MNHPPETPSPSTRAGTNAFSLVELLTVICIMSLVAALSTPAVVGTLRGSSLTGTGNRLADMATLARQAAMSRNVITALILTPKPEDAGARQGAILLELDPRKSADWEPSSGWVHLPESVTASDPQGNADGAERYAPLPGKVGATSLKDCSALVFLPDGRMDSPSGDRRLETRLDGADPASNYYDLVFNTENSAFRIDRP